MFVRQLRKYLLMIKITFRISHTQPTIPRKNIAQARRQPYKSDASPVFYGIATDLPLLYFCVVFANALQYIAILVPAVKKSCLNSISLMDGDYMKNTRTDVLISPMGIARSYKNVLKEN